MRRTLLVTMLLLWGLILPSHAQTDARSDTVATIFPRLTISEVELRLPDPASDALPELHFVVQETVCDVHIDFDALAMSFGVLAVDVYSEYEDIDCEAPAPAEQSIELSRFSEDQRYIVLINDFSSQFYLPAREDGTSDEAFAAQWDSDNFLIPFQRVASPISDIDIALTDAQTITLTVSGDHPDGCETDTFAVLRRNQPYANEYSVDVMRLLPQGVMCPTVLQVYEVTKEVAINDTFDPLDEPDFLVGETLYVAIREAWIPIERERPSVTDVSIEAESTSFRVSFDAQLPATCADRFADPRVYDTAFYSQIEFVILRPADVTCEGTPVAESVTMNVRSLPVFINGIAYDENGVVPPRAAAQSDQNTAQSVEDGNFMRVNTVIDSVDVEVLESFPMQLTVTVTGSQPDGCDLPVIVEQSVEDNTVTLAIYRNVPTDIMCPAVLVPYEETIAIDGTFEGGTVTLNINDFTTSVDL